MVKIIPSGDNSIFALDIGTRTVIGVVALMESGRLRLAAQHMVEHEHRSMFDGQIHDIPRVADTVLEVKRNLEKKVGFKFTGAAIAAAGRSLITKQSRAEMEIEDSAEIDSTLVNSLEIAGLRNAQNELEAGIEDAEKYYCVGYSVVKYYLNNYPITNLVGHRGKLIGADLLATFLPESVVNGLYSVLRRVDLEPVNLTLEPIAAIEAVIPESLRLLNLALVDIGAGTSDIAITRKGAVVSYGMVPVAGDEITEAIAEAFLVDFNEAEKIKRAMGNNGDIAYRDIIGIENTITAGEVAAAIEPVLDRLTLEVAGAIINLNGGEPPRTVFCVGGGSRLPGLTEKLAAQLGINPRHVAVRGREAIRNLEVDEDGLEGPEGVTVAGIGMVAVKKLGQSFLTIKVDGKEFSLFNARDLSVANALSQVDFNPRDLIGYNGKDLKFTLNGEPRVIYGGLAKPAEIYINGERANLKSLIKEGDDITVYKAGHGEDARVRLSDLLEGVDLEDCTIRINGAETAPDYELKDGDEVTLLKKDSSNQDNRIEEVFNKKKDEPLESGETISVTVNGSVIKLEGNRQYIFVDIFNHLDLDLAANRGTPVLKLNGVTAGYTDVLKDGDSIEINWI